MQSRFEEAVFDHSRSAFAFDRIRFIKKMIVVLHLFSGRRRDGDLQHTFEDTFACAGYCILVLSISTSSLMLTSATSSIQPKYYIAER